MFDNPGKERCRTRASESKSVWPADDPASHTGALRHMRLAGASRSSTPAVTTNGTAGVQCPSMHRVFQADMNKNKPPLQAVELFRRISPSPLKEEEEETDA